MKRVVWGSTVYERAGVADSSEGDFDSDGFIPM